MTKTVGVTQSLVIEGLDLRRWDWYRWGNRRGLRDELRLSSWDWPRPHSMDQPDLTAGTGAETGVDLGAGISDLIIQPGSSKDLGWPRDLTIQPRGSETDDVWSTGNNAGNGGAVTADGDGTRTGGTGARDTGTGAGDADAGQDSGAGSGTGPDGTGPGGWAETGGLTGTGTWTGTGTVDWTGTGSWTKT